ncbi:MAG TPA: hypothetical protein VJA20_01135 [Candidatus Nanoarchaeia archaeon]|nr:hypothetical protein [Candidatus Nanoarchaeia archaeon]
MNNDDNQLNKKIETEKDKNLSAEEALNEIEGKPNKTQTEQERKQLRNVLLGLGIFVILIILAVFFINSIKSFEYKETKFDIVREGDLILYNTKVALFNEKGEHYQNYNFFLRNDPRKSKVNFNGELELKKLVVINSEEEFNCDGDGIIAVLNLRQLYEILGAKVVKDENATCDSEGKYMYINLKEGKETRIEQTGTACYDILINNCEILEGTEKFMVETFAKVNE